MHASSSAHLKLYRDIYYTQSASTARRGTSRYQLGPDEYFVLGDNSGELAGQPEMATPGVPEADFIGKPFLHPPAAAARPQ